jgi:hypothetical protein
MGEFCDQADGNFERLGEQSARGGKARAARKGVGKPPPAVVDFPSPAADGFGKFRLLERDVEIPIAAIQPLDVRAKGSNRQRVAEYRDNFENGILMPNIAVFRDEDGILRMADGNHRIVAATLAGRETITADIFSGGQAECLEYTLLANRHGESFRPQDTVNAIGMMGINLNQANLSELSRQLGISRATLRAYRDKARTGRYGAIAAKIRLPSSREEM